MAGRLILASASPRRHELMSSWDLIYEVHIADLDEKLKSGVPCEEQAEDLAIQKATCVAAAYENNHDPVWILGADTLVTCSGNILGKPLDHQDAHRMLMSLSGQSVEVITGVAVVNPDKQVMSGFCSTQLKMFPFLADEAAAYVATDEPMGKAGAFAIQGLGGALIAERKGSYSNVVGLPKALVFELLVQAQYLT